MIDASGRLKRLNLIKITNLGQSIADAVDNEALLMRSAQPEVGFNGVQISEKTVLK